MGLQGNQQSVLIRIINKIFTEKPVTKVSQRANGDISILHNQKVYSARKASAGKVSVSDSYGVMTGAENWALSPEERSLTASTTNGFDEAIAFVWAISQSDKGGEIFHQIREAQQELWRAARIEAEAVQDES